MDHDKQEPIAIVGAACRFAGDATSLPSLWDMLSKARTGHGPVPGDRWDSSRWYHPDPDRKGGIPTQHGYFLQGDITKFDAPFFSVTAKEAAAMDPMKRMLLETSYESLENAGIRVEDLMNSQTGCYVGCMSNDYEMISLHDIYDIGYMSAAATSEAMISNRVSWFFGLKGPSLTLDTACSSSLYALHLACQSLRLKETNLSLVAGVNLMIGPSVMHQMTAMHMLSPEGISHTFDDRANGYGRGDGIGALIVKRLSDAIRDGDTIRAVIRGSSINADGKTPSVTQPSSQAQAELIDQTYAAAGLDQSDTQYCECHGTGTPIGDPLELTAIGATLGAARQKAGKSPLYIGSIKPTVGHTEGCAGLAGVFKSILLLEKGRLVPTYGVERVNPKLKLKEWNLELPSEILSWPAGRRRISVNSFGFGGANAHVILEDAYHYFKERNLEGKHNTVAHEEAKIVPLDSKKLFLFSARDEAGAKRVAESFKGWLETEQPNLDDLAFTLAQRRTHLEQRTFATANSQVELSERLTNGLPAAMRSGRNGENLIMVFTGQGAQWPAMGRELFTHPVFRASLEISQFHLTALGCKWDAVEELSKTPNPNIDSPEYSQPLCTVVQVALIDLLNFWKIKPTATIGHSSGEIAAAYAAMLLTHYDAIKLAYVRGVSSAAVSKQGAMMAAGLSEDDAAKYLKQVPEGSAVVACINSPSSVTLSGDVEAINQLEKLISGDSKFARKLKVTTAYHSPHMREVSPRYLEMIGDITPRRYTEHSPVMYSSLTGKIVTSSKELDAQYWVNNMQNPVKFAPALLALLKHKATGARTAVQWGAFLEVGPHAALQGPTKQTLDVSGSKSAKSAPYTSMLLRSKDAVDTSLSAAGILWAAGYKVDLEAINRHQSPQMLADLPTYPWNHARSFWHETNAARSYRFPQEVRSDYLGWQEDSQNRHAPRWRNYLRVSENPWIEDHTITGTVLYPGAGMLVMAIEGALRTADASKTVEGFRLSDIKFERGLVISLDDQAPVETRADFHPHHAQAGAWTFTVYSMNKAAPWVKHCSGTVALVYEQEASEVDSADAVWQSQLEQRQDLMGADSTQVDVEEFYDHLDSIGMQYGPTFRNVTKLSSVHARDASYGSVAVPDTAATMPKNHESPHVIHPATLDSIFHLLLASLSNGQPMEEAAVPYGIEDMFIAKDQPREAGALYSGFGRVLSNTGHEIITDLVVSDEAWQKPKLTINNFVLRQVTSADSGEAITGKSTTSKNCAGITWIPDLAFLTGTEDLAKLVKGDAAAWANTCMDSVFLKTANTTLLVMMFDVSTSSIDVLRGLQNRTYGPKKIVAVASSESGVDLMRESLGVDGDATVTYECKPEAELLQMQPDGFDFFLGLGTPDLSTNVTTLAKLAPQSCFTHAGQPSDVVAASNRKCIGRLADDGTYVLLADGNKQPVPALPDSVTLLMPASPCESIATLASALQTRLETLGASVAHAHLTPDGVASLAGKTVISLLEVDRALVYAWDEEQFTAFKTLVSTVGHMFWMTRGGVLQSWANGVEFAASQGLFRVMRNEYPVAVLPTMDISAVADITSPNMVDLVLAVWRTALDEDADMEYAEENGVIYLPRTTEEAGFDYELQLSSKTAPPVPSPLGSENPLQASVEGGKCVWTADPDATAPLAPGIVEVLVEYAGLGSGSSLDTVRHAVGIVTRSKSAQFKPGQRVVVFVLAAARTHVRQNENLVAPLPQGLEPQEAVALAEPLLTAQYALTEVAHLVQKHSVLLDNAASAVGQALIQVAQGMGAGIFALVHSRAERDLLATHLKVPQDRIFDAGRSNFVPLIQQASKHGVNVVVSQQAGTHVAGAMTLLNDFGQFIDLSNGTSSLPASKTNATLARIDMAAVLQTRYSLVSTLFQRTFSSKALRGPSPLTVMPITDLPASASEHKANVVSFTKTSKVLVPAPLPQELKLSPDATYVLAGGLGALGLNIANWMAVSGAKHLVFLSRSGGSKNTEDLEKLEEQGVKAEARQCDVTDSKSVAGVFDSLRSSGCKVAGVVQMAMVLDDNVFDNMTFDMWKHAIHPKTLGSRNLLANLWPSEKPFFILLSSITGVIGNTAQANYAAGNTFEDALAHHARHHLGIPATSIDVGLVSDSTHFTGVGAFGSLDGYLGRYSHGWRGLQCTVAELGVAMRAIMRGNTTDGKRVPAQLVLGLGNNIEYNPGDAGGFAHDKKFEQRVVRVGGGSEGKNAEEGIGAKLANATSLAEATAIVEDNLKDRVAESMGIALKDVDANKPLYDYGVDSLQAAETRNRALKNMRSDISVFDILSAMPLAEVASKIASKSQLLTFSVGNN